MWGEPFRGREALGLRHLPQELPPASRPAPGGEPPRSPALEAGGEDRLSAANELQVPQGDSARRRPPGASGGWLSSVRLLRSVQVPGGQLCFWSAPKGTWTRLGKEGPRACSARAAPSLPPACVGRMVCGAPATLFYGRQTPSPGAGQRPSSSVGACCTHVPPWLPGSEGLEQGREEPVELPAPSLWQRLPPSLRCRHRGPR